MLSSHLLVQSAEDLLLLHRRELSPPEINYRHVALRAQLLRCLQFGAYKLETILLQGDLGLQLCNLGFESPHEQGETLPLGPGALLLRLDVLGQ